MDNFSDMWIIEIESKHNLFQPFNSSNTSVQSFATSKLKIYEETDSGYENTRVVPSIMQGYARSRRQIHSASVRIPLFSRNPMFLMYIPKKNVIAHENED